MEQSLGSSARGRVRHPRRAKAVVVGIALAAMVLSACGSGGSTAKSPSSTTPGSGTQAVVKTLGKGVTADSIKVGITLVDFDCIKDYTDSIRLGQEAVYGAFIKDINDKGGIAGRKIDPVYKTYCPITSGPLLTLCTSLAQDENVFAVIGTFFDSTGDAQTCITKQEQRVLLTFDLTQSIIDNAPPGLMVTPGTIPERSVNILLTLAKKEKTFEGKKVAILGDTTMTKVVKGTIEPGLKDLGVQTGTTALVSINKGGDTTIAQQQLDSFIEKWKTENVDTIFMSGNFASTKQFVQKLKAAMPDVMLVADNTNTLEQAQQLQSAGVKPNPYEGLITAGGLSASEADASANWKFCAEIYTRETGKKAEKESEVIKSADGKNILDEHGTISDACQLLWTFHDIGQKVGPYLNNTNWENTVNTFGKIANRGSGDYASLHQGKYSTDDNWRLQAYDSTLPPEGNWKPITPLENVPN
jgi:ABC-type branched-subunit amino acid transport system substrate-binding protein